MVTLMSQAMVGPRSIILLMMGAQQLELLEEIILAIIL